MHILMLDPNGGQRQMLCRGNLVCGHTLQDDDFCGRWSKGEVSDNVLIWRLLKELAHLTPTLIVSNGRLTGPAVCSVVWLSHAMLSQ